jgi:chromosomal replication initiation ATPase DnaA
MPRITVAIRFRPDEDQKKIENLSCRPETGLIDLSVNGTKQEFTFDKLLTENATQEDVFKSCAIPIIDEVIEGYNGCIFAYGQTGAGKTHTMSGPTDIDSMKTVAYVCVWQDICLIVHEN